MFNSARGTSLKTTIERITPVLRGWRNYYRLDTRKKYWSEMDERIRHHLRKLIWIAWKRPKTRERNLIKLGLDPETAWKSSVNGRGAWWNSGQAHMNLAIKNRRFARLGLFYGDLLMKRPLRNRTVGAVRGGRGNPTLYSIICSFFESHF